MNKRGVTLVEVMVASSLLALLLVISAQLFIPAIRAWDRQQKQTESSQGNLVAINWLEKDLSLAKIGSVSFRDGNTLTLIKSKAQVGGKQNPFRIRVTYRLSDGVLFRSQQEFEPNDKSEGIDIPIDKGLPIARTVEKFIARTPQDWVTEIELASRVELGVSEVQTSVGSVYAPLDAALEEKTTSSR